MLTDVILHGQLAAACGRRHRLDVATPREAIRALCVVAPSFRPTLSAGTWRLVVGERGRRREIGADEIDWHCRTLHIVPAVEGSGRGIGKVVLGAVLIGAAFAFAPAAVPGVAGTGLGATAATVFGASITYGQIAMFGVTLALSGVAQMLAPRPKAASGGAEGAEQRPSYLMTGPSNIATQGVPVPVAYGLCAVGSVVVSAGLSAEEYGTTAAAFPPISGGKTGIIASGTT